MPSSKGNYTWTGSGQLSASSNTAATRARRASRNPAGQTGRLRPLRRRLQPHRRGSYDLYGPSQLSAPPSMSAIGTSAPSPQSGGPNTAGNLYLGYFFGYGSNGSYSLAARASCLFRAANTSATIRQPPAASMPWGPSRIRRDQHGLFDSRPRLLRRQRHLQPERRTTRRLVHQPGFGNRRLRL